MCNFVQLKFFDVQDFCPGSVYIITEKTISDWLCGTFPDSFVKTEVDIIAKKNNRCIPCISFVRLLIGKAMRRKIFAKPVDDLRNALEMGICSELFILEED